MKSLRLLSILFLIAINGCEMVVENGFPDQRMFVIGDYEIEEYSELDGTMFYYDVGIYKSGYAGDHIIIYNLYDSGLDILARVYDNGEKIRIPLQRLENLEFEGAGTLFNGNELSLTYVVRDVQSPVFYTDYLSAVGWKY